MIHQVSLKIIFLFELFFVWLKEYFSRSCLPSGNWSTFNFGSCFYPDILELLNKSYIGRPPEEREVFGRIIRVLRYIELAGLSISLTSILISLLIFFSFK